MNQRHQFCEFHRVRLREDAMSQIEDVPGMVPYLRQNRLSGSFDNRPWGEHKGWIQVALDSNLLRQPSPG